MFVIVYGFEIDFLYSKKTSQIYQNLDLARKKSEKEITNNLPVLHLGTIFFLLSTVAK